MPDLEKLDRLIESTSAINGQLSRDEFVFCRCFDRRPW